MYKLKEFSSAPVVKKKKNSKETQYMAKYKIFFSLFTNFFKR